MGIVVVVGVGVAWFTTWAAARPSGASCADASVAAAAAGRNGQQQAAKTELRPRNASDGDRVAQLADACVMMHAAALCMLGRQHTQLAALVRCCCGCEAMLQRLSWQSCNNEKDGSTNMPMLLLDICMKTAMVQSFWSTCHAQADSMPCMKKPQE